MNLLARRFLPIFQTKKKASIFPAITRESITREADTKRAPRGNYNRDSFQAKDRQYACEEHGLEGPLDDSEREMYATDFDAELTTVQIVTRRVLQAQEKRMPQKFLTPQFLRGQNFSPTFRASLGITPRAMLSLRYESLVSR